MTKVYRYRIGTGSRHCVVTLVERRTGYVLIGKLRARTQAELNRRTVALIARNADRFKTVTADNGTAFMPTTGSNRPPASPSTSPPCITLGNTEATRTPMDSSVSTSPNKPV